MDAAIVPSGPVPTVSVMRRLALCRRGQPLRTVAELVVVVGLVMAASGLFGQVAGQLEFWRDEGHHIWAARYFAHLFLVRDLEHPEWEDHFVGDGHYSWAHDHLMLRRYLIGAWLGAHGYNLYELPGAYFRTKSFTEDLEQGRVPNCALLSLARAPMVGLATGVVLLLYVLVRVVGGFVAGATAAGLALASPLVQRELVLVQTESLLMFFVLLTLLLAMLGARGSHAGALSVRWAIPLGIALGLACATKVTALLSWIAIAVWAAVVALQAARRAWRKHARCAGASEPAGWWQVSMKPSAMLGHVWHAAHGWALALALALIVFVLSNPHLYPDPMLHVVHLFQYLYESMAAQQLELPQDARYGLSERLSYVLGASLLGSSPLPGSVPNLPMMLGTAVMALLATVGLGTLLARVARGPGAAGRLPAEGLLVVTLMVYVAGVSAGLGLAWQRYLVPTCLLAILLSALGLAVVARHLAGRANASRAGE